MSAHPAELRQPEGPSPFRKFVRGTMLVLLALGIPALALGENAPVDGYPVRIVLPEATPMFAPAALNGDGADQPVITQASYQAPAIGPAGSFTDRMRAEQCMAMAIYYEAASEGEDGQRAVAQVVLNRVSHPAYPDSVCGVVFQGSERSTGCQFSFTCDGSLARKPDTRGWAEARRLAWDALHGAVYAPVGLATHYHRSDINPYWSASLNPLGAIGAHSFYVWRGKAGEQASFSEAYIGGEPLPVRHVPSPAAVTYLNAVHPAPAQPAKESAAAPRTDLAAAAPAQIAASAEAPAADRLPQGGQVLARYADSGKWLDRP